MFVGFLYIRNVYFIVRFKIYMEVFIKPTKRKMAIASNYETAIAFMRCISTVR